MMRLSATKASTPTSISTKSARQKAGRRGASGSSNRRTFVLLVCTETYLRRFEDAAERRGELDEALRIHCKEELPVYRRLGDVREQTVTLGKIADILFKRGELDEALRIQQEEALPAYELLGDVGGLASITPPSNPTTLRHHGPCHHH